ncbi:MAG: beta-ribofuranosylaminobenzene 5'-phosphate synthase family protein, partial [Candidatus Methanospirareceae archaeon]
RIRILRNLPRHVGLGSQTQLSLSVAKAIMVSEGKEYSTRELARIVERGGTSGIGVAAFDKGGFILDGGHVFGKDAKEGDVKTDFLPSSASKVPPPPVLFQHPLPEDWFFVVAIPDVKRGAHGAEEVEIFKKYCPIRGEEVEKICRIVLMRILPSVIEKDIETFAESLTMLQYIGFKKKEVELQHDIIKQLFSFFENLSLGYGMSSFGPTTYAVVKGEGKARKIAEETRIFLENEGFPSFVTYSNANNKGSEVKIIRDTYGFPS